jgi:hypothetical protein
MEDSIITLITSAFLSLGVTIYYFKEQIKKMLTLYGELSILKGQSNQTI